MNKDKLEILKAMQRYVKSSAPFDFASFLLYINPTYQLKWFHSIIAKKCMQLVSGEIKNLMVFIPPQCGKSEIVSRNFPAWLFGRDPNAKIVGCSYSADLAGQFSRSIQRIIDDPNYQAIFPKTYLNGTPNREQHSGYLRNVDIFEIVGNKGFYKAVGIGGGLTGTPVDFAIIDDPVKDAQEAYSAVYRKRVWEWYNTVLTTRLNNNSRQLFIMTRWHEDDLAGRILRKEPEKWEVLSIPAICETPGDGGLSNRKIGEALWEERHSLERLLQQKERGAREFASLYQQHPTIEGGNIIKREWFKFVDLKQMLWCLMYSRSPIHYFVDTAYSKKKQGIDNDPTGIIGAFGYEGNIYIVRAEKVYKDMPDLLRWLPDYIDTPPYNDYPHAVHIEPKANGKSVVQMLRETPLNVAELPSPTESKETRLMVASPRVECGKVYLVEGSWNEDFINEICAFPTAPHDEYVDLLAYAIDYVYADTRVQFNYVNKYTYGL